jgi:hypothetical protein
LNHVGEASRLGLDAKNAKEEISGRFTYHILYCGVLVLFLMIACMGMAVKQVEAASLKVSNPEPIRVLFIGNSYTYFNDLPWLTQQLAVSARETRPLETEMIVVGGATLKSHWERGEAKKRIRAKRWDYVVLQEQSNLPITNPKLMSNYARLFDAQIKLVNSQTLFYLTWAKSNRPETQQILTDSYMEIARELGAKVAPVGIAWKLIHEANPSLKLYDSDGSHPSPVGSYVAACVFYSTFYQKSPLGLSRRIYISQDGNRIELQSLSKTDAETIQRSVWQVISKDLS